MLSVGEGSLRCSSSSSSLRHTKSESQLYVRSGKCGSVSFLSGSVLTMLPLNESASFKPFSEAVTGWVPWSNEVSSHFPEVVYRTLPMPIDPGSRPNHSCMALERNLGTKSRFL